MLWRLLIVENLLRQLYQLITDYDKVSIHLTEELWRKAYNTTKSYLIINGVYIEANFRKDDTKVFLVGLAGETDLTEYELGRFVRSDTSFTKPTNF